MVKCIWSLVSLSLCTQPQATQVVDKECNLLEITSTRGLHIRSTNNTSTHTHTRIHSHTQCGWYRGQRKRYMTHVSFSEMLGYFQWNIPSSARSLSLQTSLLSLECWHEVFRPDRQLLCSGVSSMPVYSIHQNMANMLRPWMKAINTMLGLGGGSEASGENTPDKSKREHIHMHTSPQWHKTRNVVGIRSGGGGETVCAPQTNTSDA